MADAGLVIFSYLCAVVWVFCREGARVIQRKELHSCSRHLKYKFLFSRQTKINTPNAGVRARR